MIKYSNSTSLYKSKRTSSKVYGTRRSRCSLVKKTRLLKTLSSTLPREWQLEWCNNSINSRTILNSSKEFEAQTSPQVTTTKIAMPFKWVVFQLKLKKLELWCWKVRTLSIMASLYPMTTRSFTLEIWLTFSSSRLRVLTVFKIVKGLAKKERSLRDLHRSIKMCQRDQPKHLRVKRQSKVEQGCKLS